MLKILIVLLPMVVGASLAGAARAATPLDMAAQPATISIQGSFASLPAEGVRTLQGQVARLANAESIVGSTVVAGNTSRLPEPASWAIMLTGFGLIGAAARHRRARRLA